MLNDQINNTGIYIFGIYHLKQLLRFIEINIIYLKK